MYVIGGGSLSLRSPVIPVDCAKLHVLWLVCMYVREGAEKGVPRDLLTCAG
jgi:hypothetical protein